LSAVVSVGGTALGVVLLVAAAGKALGRWSPDRFLAAAGLPRGLVPPARVGVPIAEGGVGALLVAGVRASALCVAAAGLLAAFAAVQGRVYATRPQTSCGCFGALDENLPPWLALARAVVLALAGAAVAAGAFLDGGGSIDAAAAASGAATGIAFLLALALLGRVLWFERWRRLEWRAPPTLSESVR
jgi:hypothetical protein